MLKFPSIPEPQADVNALYQSVSALKQIAEELIGQRGTDGTTIASQTDLADVSDLLSVVKKAADAASPVGHTHPESDVTSLVADIASKEPAITGTGNTTDYYGGDKTFHAFPTAAQKVVADYYDSYTTYALLSVVIPFDDTIPTSTEGTQILSRSVTTTSATQRVTLRFTATGSSVSITVLTYAIFRGTTCIGVGATHVNTNTIPHLMALNVADVPGAGTFTYSVRVGASSGNVGMNGSNTARLYGGASVASLLTQVIEP